MALVSIHSSGIMTIIDTISRVDVVSLLLFLQLFPQLFCQSYQSRDDSLELNSCAYILVVILSSFLVLKRLL